MSFSIGPYALAAPVVLAPMAGVTNAPFRELCRRYAPGLVYVNEMVMATAVVHGNAKTDRMITLRRRGVAAQPAAVRVRPADHGGRGATSCATPAASTTSTSTSAARPPRSRARAVARRCRLGPNCCARSCAPRSRTPAPYGVPVTAKFRMGLFDDVLTHIRTGEVCAEEGVAAIALHARTVRAALRRRRPLGRDRRAEGGRALDPGARQRRHLGGRRRRRDDGRDRLRRRRHRARLPRAAVAVRRLSSVFGGRRPPPSRPLGDRRWT